jgi:alpha-ketoglutarate-dependent taurine dioxygenase
MKTRTFNYKVLFKSQETLTKDEYIIEPIYFLQRFGELFEHYSKEHPIHLSVTIDKTDTQIIEDRE